MLAQESYGLAAGLRLGIPSALSLKGFVSERTALELSVARRLYADVATAAQVRFAVQLHRPLGRSASLAYYFGPDVGVQWWDYDYDDGRHLTASLGANLGLQYAPPRSRLVLSLDYTPYVNLLFRPDYRGMDSYMPFSSALGIRYRLIR